MWIVCLWMEGVCGGNLLVCGRSLFGCGRNLCVCGSLFVERVSYLVYLWMEFVCGESLLVFCVDGKCLYMEGLFFEFFFFLCG